MGGPTEHIVQEIHMGLPKRRIVTCPYIFFSGPVMTTHPSRPHPRPQTRQANTVDHPQGFCTAAVITCLCGDNLSQFVSARSYRFFCGRSVGRQFERRLGNVSSGLARCIRSPRPPRPHPPTMHSSAAACGLALPVFHTPHKMTDAYSLRNVILGHAKERMSIGYMAKGAQKLWGWRNLGVKTEREASNDGGDGSKFFKLWCWQSPNEVLF